MAEIKVKLPNELVDEAKKLGEEELNRLVRNTVKEKLSERAMFRLADKIREKSSLTEEQEIILSEELKEKVAERHGLK